VHLIQTFQLIDDTVNLSYENITWPRAPFGTIVCVRWGSCVLFYFILVISIIIWR